MTAPSDARRSFVRTNAPPLPGLTCWNSRILKTVPSTSMWLPFLNWLVEITPPLSLGGPAGEEHVEDPLEARVEVRRAAAVGGRRGVLSGYGSRRQAAAVSSQSTASAASAVSVTPKSAVCALPTATSTIIGPATQNPTT